MVISGRIIVFCTLVSNFEYVDSQVCPLSAGASWILTPSNARFLVAPMNLHPKQHLHQFNNFHRAHSYNQQAGRQTDHSTPSVAIGCTVKLCMLCGLIIEIRRPRVTAELAASQGGRLCIGENAVWHWLVSESLQSAAAVVLSCHHWEMNDPFAAYSTVETPNVCQSASNPQNCSLPYKKTQWQVIVN